MHIETPDVNHQKLVIFNVTVDILKVRIASGEVFNLELIFCCNLQWNKNDKIKLYIYKIKKKLSKRV